MKRYRLHFDVESDEDGTFIAYCPQIQGCHAVGGTVAEAISNAEDVARVMIELWVEHGWPLPPEDLEPPRELVGDANLVVSVGA